MKFSFSTKGWHNSSFEDFCDIAENLKFRGIELHNVNNSLFTDHSGAFQDYSAASTLRLLYDKKLSIPCIDIISDISVKEEKENALREIERCFEIAAPLTGNFSEISPAAMRPPLSISKISRRMGSDIALMVV